MNIRIGNKQFAAVVLAICLTPGLGAFTASGYVLHRTIAAPDPRNNGVPFCPMPNHFGVAAGTVDRRWDTTLGNNIITSGAGVSEVDGVIQESFSVWTQVQGSGLAAGSLGPLTQVTGGASCNSGDGVNSICFTQPAAFASGVLAFTQVLAADVVGQQAGAKTASFVGEILDADLLVNPDPKNTFATPTALPGNPGAYDLESILIHELGHFFGFSHSLVVGAMMYPFAPPVGTYTGTRPSSGAPDAPLGDDDRAGLRVLYSGGAAFGVIRGRILPVNPLSLQSFPATSAGHAVTGYYGTHVVAVDADSGQTIAGTLGGYYCDASLQISIFDGSYEIGGLPLGHRYKIYAEPLNGPVPPAEVSEPLNTEPCRAGTANNCFPPALNTNFTTKIRP